MIYEKGFEIQSEQLKQKRWENLIILQNDEVSIGAAT